MIMPAYADKTPNLKIKQMKHIQRAYNIIVWTSNTLTTR